MALTSKELQNPVIAKVAQWFQFRTALVFKDGVCPMLDTQTNRCTIYEERPSVCRRFNCHDMPKRNPFFSIHPHIKELLKAEKLRATITASTP